MAGEAIAGFIVLFFIVFWLAFIVFAILGLIFWIFMLVDAAKRNFQNKDEKVVWIIIVALAGLIGALVYYFVIKRKDKSKSKPKKK